MKRLYRYSTLILILLLASGCSAVTFGPASTPSALDPHGFAASHIASLWWVMLAFGAGTFFLVIGLMFAAILKRQRATSATTPDSNGGDTGRSWVIRGGIALPLVVLGIVFGYNIYTLAAVENPQNQAALHIKVIARRWWWEVQYPEQGFTTANEIHLPVGVPVQIALESDDVIHSFWVPELHGKMDLIPGHPNTITLQADQTGVYRGVCAEFCGLQHAHMGFMVVAQSSADYNQWVSGQQQPISASANPAVQQGQQVFFSAGCVFCHNVRGLDVKTLVPSPATLGPDLTHLASRLTIAGATLSENPGTLGGWVIDPQHVKPGSLMPENNISPQDLQTLLAFLESLH